jgi:hypothetical protein
MSGELEQANEHLEHAAHGAHGKTHARAAIIIAVMAAALALTEFAAKDAQISYLTNHIAASDTWAQYQAKSVRRTVLTSEAELLQSLSPPPILQSRSESPMLRPMRTVCIQSQVRTVWSS